METKFEEFIEDLEEGIEVHIQDGLDEGITCPHCIAKQFIEENQTGLMADLFKLGKDDNHRELLQRLFMLSMMYSTSGYIYSAMQDLWKDVFAEEFEKDFKQITGEAPSKD